MQSMKTQVSLLDVQRTIEFHLSSCSGQDFDWSALRRSFMNESLAYRSVEATSNLIKSGDLSSLDEYNSCLIKKIRKASVFY